MKTRPLQPPYIIPFTNHKHTSMFDGQIKTRFWGTFYLSKCTLMQHFHRAETHRLARKHGMTWRLDDMELRCCEVGIMQCWEGVRWGWCEVTIMCEVEVIWRRNDWKWGWCELEMMWSGNFKFIRNLVFWSKRPVLVYLSKSDFWFLRHSPVHGKTFYN